MALYIWFFVYIQAFWFEILFVKLHYRELFFFGNRVGDKFLFLSLQKLGTIRNVHKNVQSWRNSTIYWVDSTPNSYLNCAAFTAKTSNICNQRLFICVRVCQKTELSKLLCTIFHNCRKIDSVQYCICTTYKESFLFFR